jgi:hypothetical protein
LQHYLCLPEFVARGQLTGVLRCGRVAVAQPIGERSERCFEHGPCGVDCVDARAAGSVPGEADGFGQPVNKQTDAVNLHRDGVAAFWWLNGHNVILVEYRSHLFSSPTIKHSLAGTDLWTNN